MTSPTARQPSSSATLSPNSRKVSPPQPTGNRLTPRAGFLLQKFNISKVLGVNIFLWGITTACTSVVKNGTQLIALRTLLGCLESVVTPALIMLTSAWYQKDEAAPRFGFWYCGLGMGQIVGGLISYGAQHSTNTTFQGWRVMFACIGAVNVLVAITIFLWLPASPDDSKYLSHDEKEVIAQRLREDHSGVGLKVLRVRSIMETFLDAQTWLLSILTILNVLSSGVITVCAFSCCGFANRLDLFLHTYQELRIQPEAGRALEHAGRHCLDHLLDDQYIYHHQGLPALVCHHRDAVHRAPGRVPHVVRPQE